MPVKRKQVKRCWGCNKQLQPNKGKVVSIKIAGTEYLNEPLCLSCGKYVKKLLVEKHLEKQKQMKSENRCQPLTVTKYKSKLL